MKKPSVIKGGSHTDERGKLMYNNGFDLSQIKHMYTIENKDAGFIRGWQGHKVEQRWMMPVSGSFEIICIAVDDWSEPNKELEKLKFTISSLNMEVLHIPSGYITAIRSIDAQSKLVLFSDYYLNEIQDEYRFPIDYFKEL